MAIKNDIHTLFRKVREHPDFAGGTIWTREDLAGALFDELTEETIAQITPEQLEVARDVTESWLFEGAYGWDEAMLDNVPLDNVPA